MNYEDVRDLLAPWGELRPQPASDWRGDFALPQVVAEFYERVGPWGKVVHAHQGPTGVFLDARLLVTLPPLSQLWARQAGFRWNSRTRERSGAWRDEWLLVADAEADPFILDIPSGRVLFARHGAGGWFPESFAPDLITAFGALATIANTKARLVKSDAFMDDDTLEIYSAATREILNDLAAWLKSIEKARAMLEVLDWG